MAGLSELSVGVSMDVTKLVEGGKKAESTVGLLMSVVKELTGSINGLNTTLTNFKGFNKVAENAEKAQVAISKVVPKDVSKDLAATAVAASKLDSKLGTALPASANRAGATLTDFGRIAQDAAYGPIAIANNIVPLIESFGRLKAETGSGLGALKALGSSMAGGGGLIFAFSAVTAAIGFASMGLDAWTRGFGNSTSKANEHKEVIQQVITKYDLFQKELEKVAETASKEATKVALLFAGYSDSNSGLGDRERLIEQINDIIPEYLRNLDKEKAGYDRIAQSVNAYTESLAVSTEVKGLLPQVEKTFQGIIQAQVELNKFRRLSSRGGDGLFGMSTEDYDLAEKEFTDRINKLKTQFKQEKAGLAEIAGGALSLTEILFGKKDKEDKKEKDIKTAAEKVKELLAELKRDLQTLSSQELIGAISPKEKDIAAVKLYENALKGLFDLGVNPNSQLAKGISLDFNVVQSRVNLMKRMDEVVKSVTGPNRFANGLARAIEFPVEVRANLKDIKEDFTSIAETIQSTLGGAFQSTFETIASGGKNALGVFASAIKQVIVKMVAAAATAALLAGIIGLATGGANFGAKGASSFIGGFKGLFGQLSGLGTFGAHAEGGTNLSAGLKLVGERGPELIRLPSGSDVIPNHRLGDFAGGAQVFIPDITLRGSDLLLAFDRANGRRGRNG